MVPGEVHQRPVRVWVSRVAEAVRWLSHRLFGEGGGKVDLFVALAPSAAERALVEALTARGTCITLLGLPELPAHATGARLAPALHEALARHLGDDADALVITHHREQYREHPLHWHFYNQLAASFPGGDKWCFGDDGSGRAQRVPLSAGAAQAKALWSAQLGLAYDEGDAATEAVHPLVRVELGPALLRRRIHGQILQAPQGASPGVLVSPFWDVGPDEENVVAAVLQDHCAAHRWHFVMADTCYRNLPPRWIAHLARSRFCVDSDEWVWLESNAPDLDLLDVCQSHALSREAYRSLPDMPKVFDLVYNGRFGAVKRHAMLIDALDELKRRGEAMRALFLCYPKDDEDTRSHERAVLDRLAGSGLDVTVATTGGRGNNEQAVVEWMARCRFGILMSEVEGPALVMAEYLLCGLPVVACGHLRGGGLAFLDETNSRLFEGGRDLPDVLVWMRDNHGTLEPRQSALLHGIGESEGNRRLAGELARCGVALRAESVPMNRSLAWFPLEALVEVQP